MSRYDGLIIPRSYSEYINKTDAATLLQALQQSGVMDNDPTPGSSKPITSNAVANSFGTWETLWISNTSIVRGIICNGKAIITIHLQGFECSSNEQVITTVAKKYRPRSVSRGYCFAAENPLLVSYINIEANGMVVIAGMNGKTVYGDSIIIIEKDV